MKICIVTPAFPHTEEDYRAAFSLDFARALERRGHTVVVHTPDKTGPREDLGLTVERFRWAGGHKAVARTRLWHPRDLYELASLRVRGRATLDRLVRRHEIDACLALWAVPSGVFARDVKRSTGTPYSVWALGSDIWTYGRVPIFRQIIRRVFADADCAWADGFELARMVERITGRTCGFLPSARVLPGVEETDGAARTGEDQRESDPSPDVDVVTAECVTEQDYGVARGCGASGGTDGAKSRFLFVGRFDTVKGVETLIAAVRQLHARRGDFRVTIRGEGPLAGSLQSQASGLEECVRMGGPVSRREFAMLLAVSDALVIPSRMESIPVVMTDALQKGVPVLASDVGDMGHLIRTYGVGDLFRAGDVDGIAACLERFMDEPHSYRERIPELTAEINIERAAALYLDSLSERE